jgi:uncharacterized heparinase superfamily protein
LSDNEDRDDRPRGIGITDDWWLTPLHQMRLRGPDPDNIQMNASSRQNGDAARGRDIMRGLWRFGSQRLTVDVEEGPWAFRGASATFVARLHSFSWLRDLAAVGTSAKPLIARYIRRWGELYGAWDASVIWHPDVTAERVIAWLSYGSAAFERDDMGARVELLRSLGRQSRHLSLTTNVARDPRPKLRMATALILAGTAVDEPKYFDQGFEIFRASMASLILPDGGHISRSPEALAEAFFFVLTVEDTLYRRGVEMPEDIRQTRDRMADMLRFFTLGDGGLLSANGGGEGPRAALAEALAEFPPKKLFQVAPQSGFHRVELGSLRAVIDVGAAPPSAAATEAHAGVGSFEVTTGNERFLINVGSGFDYASSWRRQSRRTIAHNCLVVDDKNSASIVQSRLGRGIARVSGPRGVRVTRNDFDGGSLIDLRHEGYRAEFGFIHQRRLFFEPNGSGIIGEDSLFRPASDKPAPETAPPVPYSIHFHVPAGVNVYPEVFSNRRDDGTVENAPGLLLVTPGGRRWFLRTDVANPTIEESAYLSGVEGSQKTLQIVLRGSALPNGRQSAAPNLVRWRFDHVGGPA